MAVLTFSSVDNADLVLLLQALQLWNLSSTLQVQEDMNGRHSLVLRMPLVV